jgi:hypothetical protein
VVDSCAEAIRKLLRRDVIYEHSGEHGQKSAWSTQYGGGVVSWYGEFL